MHSSHRLSSRFEESSLGWNSWSYGRQLLLIQQLFSTFLQIVPQGVHTFNFISEVWQKLLTKTIYATCPAPFNGRKNFRPKLGSILIKFCKRYDPSDLFAAAVVPWYGSWKFYVVREGCRKANRSMKRLSAREVSFSLQLSRKQQLYLIEALLYIWKPKL